MSQIPLSCFKSLTSAAAAPAASQRKPLKVGGAGVQRADYCCLFLLSLFSIICLYWASLVAQTVKILPAMQQTREMRVQSLGWEDPPEKEMASHSSILTWKIPRTEEPGLLQSMGSHRVKQDWLTDTFAFFLCMYHFNKFFKSKRYMSFGGQECICTIKKDNFEKIW